MANGFRKCHDNPVLGPGIGACFDVSVLFDQGRYRMWFSWRPHKAIAYVESSDGVAWSGRPKILIKPRSRLGALFFGRGPRHVSRPCVVFHDGRYHLWYCEHADRISIAYAVSGDGLAWKRHKVPVLAPGAALGEGRGDVPLRFIRR